MARPTWKFNARFVLKQQYITCHRQEWGIWDNKLNRWLVNASHLRSKEQTETMLDHIKIGWMVKA